MSNNALSNIKHVVVLMFENRSFDHIFGGLPGLNGVLNADGTPNLNLYNLPDPLSPQGTTNAPVHPIPIDLSGQSLVNVNFNHNFGDGMMRGLFGPNTSGFLANKPLNAPAKTYPASSSGFLSSFKNEYSTVTNGMGVMTYFKQGSLTSFHTLASEFVVCDNWHCDHPGHTFPNRLFMHCATTGAVGIDDNNQGNPALRTIFDQIEGQKRDWKMYTRGQLVDTGLLNNHVRYSTNTKRPITEFYSDAANGTLPFYSFLMCWQDGATPETDTSMHPAARVEPGENYLAEVYNMLRNSKSWDDTLLIVTFDENGGMYDHMLPPTTTAPALPATTYTATNPRGTFSFDFSMLGIRIPALLISPWLDRGKVDSTGYQNTSILRFLQDMMSSQPPLSLTARDQQATSIANAFQQFGLAAARTNCPTALPYHLGFNGADIANPPHPQVVAHRAQQPPMEHVVELTTAYLKQMEGHADTGKPVTRKFPTNESLSNYVAERQQAADWHAAGLHQQSSMVVTALGPQQWTWQLKDATGAILAQPNLTYATQVEAMQAMNLVKFHMHASEGLQTT